MLEVELFGAERVPGGPSVEEVKRLCALAAAAAGVRDGHVAVEYVDSRRIAQLNGEHRGKDAPTDVLSFPIDGAGPLEGEAGPLEGEDKGPGGASREHVAIGDTPARARVAPKNMTIPSQGASVRHTPSPTPPRELGDVVICPECTADLREAIVHGMLHLVGMDHETDHGEMLRLQAQLLGENCA